MKSNYIIKQPILLNLSKYQSYYTKYRSVISNIIESEIYEKLESETLDLENIYYDIKPHNWTNKKDTKLIKLLYTLAVRLYAEVGHQFSISNLYTQRSLVDIKITERPTKLPSGEPCDQIKDIETALYFLVESGQLLVKREHYVKVVKSTCFVNPLSEHLSTVKNYFIKIAKSYHLKNE